MVGTKGKQDELGLQRQSWEQLPGRPLQGLTAAAGNGAGIFNVSPASEFARAHPAHQESCGPTCW